LHSLLFSPSSLEHHKRTTNSVPAQRALASPDGARVAAVAASSVDVYATADGRKLCSLPAAGTQFLEWSPGGRFLVTAYRAPKPADGAAPERNVKVWDVDAAAGDASGGSGATPAMELHQKSVTKEGWPVLRWAPGDAGVWHAVTNTLHFYGRDAGFKGESVSVALWLRFLWFLEQCHPPPPPSRLTNTSSFLPTTTQQHHNQSRKRCP
jgi:uncharacterized protein with WD repeat